MAEPGEAKIHTDCPKGAKCFDADCGYNHARFVTRPTPQREPITRIVLAVRSAGTLYVAEKALARELTEPLARAYHDYRNRFPGGELFCGDEFDSGPCSCRMDAAGILEQLVDPVVPTSVGGDST